MASTGVNVCPQPPSYCSSVRVALLSQTFAPTACIILLHIAILTIYQTGPPLVRPRSRRILRRVPPIDHPIRRQDSSGQARVRAEREAHHAGKGGVCEEEHAKGQVDCWGWMCVSLFLFPLLALGRIFKDPPRNREEINRIGSVGVLLIGGMRDVGSDGERARG